MKITTQIFLIILLLCVSNSLSVTFLKTTEINDFVTNDNNINSFCILPDEVPESSNFIAYLTMKFQGKVNEIIVEFPQMTNQNNDEISKTQTSAISLSNEETSVTILLSAFGEDFHAFSSVFLHSFQFIVGNITADSKLLSVSLLLEANQFVAGKSNECPDLSNPFQMIAFDVFLKQKSENSVMEDVNNDNNNNINNILYSTFSSLQLKTLSDDNDNHHHHNHNADSDSNSSFQTPQWLVVLLCTLFVVVLIVSLISVIVVIVNSIRSEPVILKDDEFDEDWKVHSSSRKQKKSEQIAEIEQLV